MKKYDIYVKDRCIFHSVTESEFKTTWNTLNIMVGIMKTEYCSEDLHYQEVVDWQPLHNTVWYDWKLIKLWQKDLL